MSDSEIKVHPAAAVFPMLAEDELRELAEDIKANGLLHPIVLDAEGAIVDGRNRDAACKLAGVEPHYQTLNGHDPVTFILSANEYRRHMSAGQRAMAVAMVLETAECQQSDVSSIGLQSKLNKGDISKAVAIRRYAADLAPGVLANTEPFDQAYKIAVARKREQDGERDAAERQAREDLIALERVRRVAPDLAALVPETLTVADAKLMLAQRQQREREARESMARVAEIACGFFDPGLKATSDELAERIVATLDSSAHPERPVFTAARFARCAETAAAIARRLESREETVHGHAASRRRDA